MAIIDMQMPGMDGETLGCKIKEDPDLSRTVLATLTSLGDRWDLTRLNSIGFAAYLTKPIKQAQLYDCLCTLSGIKNETISAKSLGIVTRQNPAEDQKHRIRILVAEDDCTNQKVALKILRKAGYNADAVANGQEAVKALEMVPYDFVLMDVQMPKMDGLAATKAIRDPNSKVQDHDVTIIAMTAHAMKWDREKCLAAGMDDYTAKPINPKDLLEKIRKQKV